MKSDGPVREKSGQKIICPGTCITQRESCYDRTYCHIYIYLSE